MVALTENGQVAEGLVAEVAALKKRGVPAQLVALNIDAATVAQADVNLSISAQIAEERFFAAAGAVYLVRPGHHINGRWISYRDNALTETLNQFIMAPAGAAA